MGEVYRARDARLNREVAIKVLPAALAHDRHRRFPQEAQSVAALNPCLCEKRATERAEPMLAVWLRPIKGIVHQT